MEVTKAVTEYAPQVSLLVVVLFYFNKKDELLSKTIKDLTGQFVEITNKFSAELEKLTKAHRDMTESNRELKGVLEQVYLSKVKKAGYTITKKGIFKNPPSD